MNNLFFDTETTGKYDFKLAPDHPAQPHLVELAAILENDKGEEVAIIDVLIKPDGWSIPREASDIHGITDEMANDCGVTLKTAAFLFANLMAQSSLMVGHNIGFDTAIMRSVFHRLQQSHRLGKVNTFCTMLSSTNICKLPGRFPDSFKWPTLSEAMMHFFQEEHKGAHRALPDVLACRRVYKALKELT